MADLALGLGGENCRWWLVCVCVCVCVCVSVMTCVMSVVSVDAAGVDADEQQQVPGKGGPRAMEEVSVRCRAPSN